MKNKFYAADDRGNIVQFYNFAGEIVATLDRESGPNANQSTWDGGDDVTAWALANGYPEVASLPKP